VTSLANNIVLFEVPRGSKMWEWRLVEIRAIPNSVLYYLEFWLNMSEVIHYFSNMSSVQLMHAVIVVIISLTDFYL